MSWFLLLLVFTPFQSKSSYKSFYKEGETFFEQKNYASALDRYKEAFRLEPEADRYREEGAFFINYMPRYKIALCLEQTDLAAAEEWVGKSKDAGEHNVLRKQKDQLATYHRDLERITKAIQKEKQVLAASYNLKLEKADDLLSQNRFEDARKAYEALYRMDPNRPEAQVGMGKIGPTRDNHIKSLALTGKSAVLEQNLDEARLLEKRIANIDPNHSELQSLRSAIRNAEVTAQKIKTEAAATRIAKKEEAVVKPEAHLPKPKETGPKTNAQAQTRSKAIDKKALKAALIASLKPYRRGDPAAALSKLKAVDPELGRKSASYHWLKSLYLVTQHRYGTEQDATLLVEAQKALSQVLVLQPGFQPASSLYPDYVLAFFNENKK